MRVYELSEFEIQRRHVEVLCSCMVYAFAVSVRIHEPAFKEFYCFLFGNVLTNVETVVTD
jgi:hypothetical protein